MKGSKEGSKQASEKNMYKAGNVRILFFTPGSACDAPYVPILSAKQPAEYVSKKIFSC